MAGKLVKTVNNMPSISWDDIFAPGFIDVELMIPISHTDTYPRSKGE